MSVIFSQPEAIHAVRPAAMDRTCIYCTTEACRRIMHAVTETLESHTHTR